MIKLNLKVRFRVTRPVWQAARGGALCALARPGPTSRATATPAPDYPSETKMCVSYPAYRILFSPQIDDVEYEDDTPDDVSADSAWGYCDSKCHVSVRDLGATVLQEVLLTRRSILGSDL